MGIAPESRLERPSSTKDLLCLFRTDSDDAGMSFISGLVMTAGGQGLLCFEWKNIVCREFCFRETGAARTTTYSVTGAKVGEDCRFGAPEFWIRYFPVDCPTRILSSS